jgi:hypothetical protein
MATVQNSYSASIAKGFAGMVPNGETGNTISRTVEDAAGIGFGVPVYRGSGDHGCTATVGTLASFYGFTEMDADLPPRAGADADEYQQYDTASIVTSGSILVEVTGAVTDGADITIGKGAGASDGIGATAADATHIATGWVADETVTDGLCRIVKR